MLVRAAMAAMLCCVAPNASQGDTAFLNIAQLQAVSEKLKTATLLVSKDVSVLTLNDCINSCPLILKQTVFMSAQLLCKRCCNVDFLAGTNYRLKLWEVVFGKWEWYSRRKVVQAESCPNPAHFGRSIPKVLDDHYSFGNSVSIDVQKITFREKDVSSQLSFGRLVSTDDQLFSCHEQGSCSQVQADSGASEDQRKQRHRVTNKLLYPALIFLSLNIIFFTYWLGTVIVPSPRVEEKNRHDGDDEASDNPNLNPALSRGGSSTSRKVSQGRYFSG